MDADKKTATVDLGTAIFCRLWLKESDMGGRNGQSQPGISRVKPQPQSAKTQAEGVGGHNSGRDFPCRIHRRHG